MKRLFLFLLSALILGGCAKESTVELVSFTDTGCSKGTKASETKAPETKAEDLSQLILEYSDAGLIITRTNATMNCSISTGGVSFDVSFIDNVINCEAYKTAGPIMKCLCPVDRMVATVAGLRTGREYVLNYSCSDVSLLPITFTYKKGMRVVVDVD